MEQFKCKICGHDLEVDETVYYRNINVKQLGESGGSHSLQQGELLGCEYCVGYNQFDDYWG